MENINYGSRLSPILKKMGYEKILKEARYGGIDFDFYAEKSSGEKLFMYARPELINFANAVNLHTIKKGNEQLQRQAGCQYVIIAPKGMTGSAREVTTNKNINIYENFSQFETEFPKHLVK